MNLFDAQTAKQVTRAVVFEGARLDDRNEINDTPLHHAIRRQAPFEVVEAMVRLGAPLDFAYDQAYQTPLGVAVHHPDISVMEHLIKSGSRVGGVYRKFDALFNAVAKDCLRRVELLLDAGAAINAQGPGLATPLFYATSWDMAKLLLSRGAQLHIRTEDGLNVVEFMEARGQVEAVNAIRGLPRNGRVLAIAR